MSKKLLVGMVLTLSSLVQAEAMYKAEYTCQFTEPFLSVVYNDSAKTVTVNEMGEQVLKISRADIKSDAKSKSLIVVDSRGNAILELSAKEGSDGMSDRVYPMTGVYQGQIGGCSIALTK